MNIIIVHFCSVFDLVDNDREILKLTYDKCTNIITNFAFGNDGRSPNKSNKVYSRCNMQYGPSFEVCGQSCKFHGVNSFEVGQLKNNIT